MILYHTDFTIVNSAYYRSACSHHTVNMAKQRETSVSALPTVVIRNTSNPSPTEVKITTSATSPLFLPILNDNSLTVSTRWCTDGLFFVYSGAYCGMPNLPLGPFSNILFLVPIQSTCRLMFSLPNAKEN